LDPFYFYLSIIFVIFIKKKITMETIAIILFGAACFAMGVYVTTQISSWIDGRIQHKKFIKNLENFDKKEDGNKSIQ